MMTLLIFAATRRSNGFIVNSRLLVSKKLSSASSSGRTQWLKLASSSEKLSDNNIDGENPVKGSSSSAFKRGQAIKFTIERFGPLGASVSIEGSLAMGLVLQNKIALFRDSRDGEDIVIGEVLDGYVERIRDDGKIDVSIRPLGASRIGTVKQVVLDAIEGSPTDSIPIGDKSSPSEIASYIHGITKTDFKNAVGALYKEGIVKPGAYETILIPESERVVKIPSSTTAMGSKSRDNDNRKVFIGNLPNRVTKEAVLKAVTEKLGTDKAVTVRLSLDDKQKPRGFGYVELSDEQYVDEAVEVLNGMELGGRVIRADYADRRAANGLSPKQQESGSSSSNGGAGSGKGWMASSSSSSSAWQQSFKRSSSIVSEEGQEGVGLDNDSSSSSSSSRTGGTLAGESRSSSSSATMGVPGDAKGITGKAWQKGNQGGLGGSGDNDVAKGWAKDALRYSGSSSSGGGGGGRGGPRATATLFVGNLAYGVDDIILKEELERVIGPNKIASIRFPVDQDTGKYLPN